jgi:pimeloyl-ACP methyl ester carboxylesterase
MTLSSLLYKSSAMLVAITLGTVMLSSGAPAQISGLMPAAAETAVADNDSTATYYRSVQVDGINVFYREAGPANAPVVMLLHGFPASSFMYRDLMTRLATTYHVIAPDYPGFGYSAVPSTKDFNYTFDHLTDVIEKFTRQLGLKKYAIYMQDFGGPVGFRLASRDPDKVSALIIQNANAYEEGLPDNFWALARTLWKTPSPANFAKLREAAISDSALEWNYTMGVKDPARISPDSWILQRALVNRSGNKDIMLALLYDYRTNLGLYAKWHDYFRKYQPPTLIVWGEHDVIFPAQGAWAYQNDLPKAELHLLDTGHFALEDKGPEIGRLMVDFLNRNLTKQQPGKLAP